MEWKVSLTASFMFCSSLHYFSTRWLKLHLPTLLPCCYPPRFPTVLQSLLHICYWSHICLSHLWHIQLAELLWMQKGQKRGRLPIPVQPCKMGIALHTCLQHRMLREAHESQWDVLNSHQSWMCPKYITWELWTDAISVYLCSPFQWQRLWACARWGWTFSDWPDLNSSSVVSVHVVSLRKALLPST